MKSEQQYPEYPSNDAEALENQLKSQEVQEISLETDPNSPFQGFHSGFQTGGAPDEAGMTIEDEIQETDMPGNHATGGDQTGERTPGGMSEDLTQGPLGEGRTYGGPTGGDIGGAGKGSGDVPFDALPDYADGGEVTGPSKRSSGQESLVMGANTKALLDQSVSRQDESGITDENA